MVSAKTDGIPIDVMRAVYTTKQLEIGKRLSDYGMQNESNVFLILRLLGGSNRSSIPPVKELDDAVELTDAPDMITWDDDPENKRAKMPCGHAREELPMKTVPFLIIHTGNNSMHCQNNIAIKDERIILGTGNLEK